MAVQVAMIGVLAGIALGLRCRVVVLVPAIALPMTFAAVSGFAHGVPWGSIILTMAILGTAVQFGYLAGAAIDAAVAPNVMIRGRNRQLNSQTGH